MRYLLFAILLFFLATSIKAPFQLEKGLVAYFSFNNCDGRDDSQQGSYGHLLGGVRCWCGVEDEGILLDGQDARVVFEGTINDYFTTSDFTLSFYFKAEQQHIFPQNIISKRAACDEEHILDIALSTTRQEVSTRFMESNTKFFKELSPELMDGTWLHYVLVREGVYARTYLNGQLIRESRRCSGIDLSNDAPFSIGDSPCVQSGRMQRFKGVLDELRLYERALNSEEVLLLYQENPVENAQMDCVS